MMQPIPGGAAAKPFITHHNALDIDLYLRIAPGALPEAPRRRRLRAVYEINRNFRNEGVSTRHNPEFTMLEFYQAYADYRDIMDWIEKAMRGLADTLNGSPQLQYQGRDYDLAKPFRRVTVEEAVIENNPGIDPLSLRDITYLRKRCEQLGIPANAHDGPGKLQIEIFEKTAEHTFLDPTFVYAYPAEVSPLSRANDADPFLTDRFEFFIAGREIANGFSELNDAEDQAARFRACPLLRQPLVRERGDVEPQPFGLFVVDPVAQSHHEADRARGRPDPRQFFGQDLVCLLPGGLRLRRIGRRARFSSAALSNAGLS